MSKQRKSTQELMNELTERLILPQEENSIPCPTCKGLRFIYKQKNDEEGYIESCRDCHNGRNYVCRHCGKNNMTDWCDCEKASEERRLIRENEDREKEQELFEKAKKISINDYDGYFILNEGSYVKDVDGVYQWLSDKISYEGLSYEELPKYLWATKSEPVLNIDLDDIIQDQCNDNGYEDMYNCLNTNDEDLIKAQEYVNKWIEKQGGSNYIYYEDCSVAVLLDDLIKEIKVDRKEVY